MTHGCTRTITSGHVILPCRNGESFLPDTLPIVTSRLNECILGCHFTRACVIFTPSSVDPPRAIVLRGCACVRACVLACERALRRDRKSLASGRSQTVARPKLSPRSYNLQSKHQLEIDLKECGLSNKEWITVSYRTWRITTNPSKTPKDTRNIEPILP